MIIHKDYYNWLKKFQSGTKFKYELGYTYKSGYTYSYTYIVTEPPVFVKRYQVWAVNKSQIIQDLGSKVNNRNIILL